MINSGTWVPLYIQLKRLIKTQIQDGVLQEGDRLSSERELAKQFGMSRMTVRQALVDLMREGLLDREQGRGTFVARRKMSQGLQRVTSFTDNMRNHGMIPSSILLGMTRELPSQPDRDRLGLSLGQQALKLRRVRLADGQPMAIEEVCLPADIMNDIQENDLIQGSLYAYLRQRHIDLVRARQTLEAILADPEQSQLLALPPMAPLLLLERLSHDQDGRPVEFVRAVYRGDRYRFHVALGGEPSKG